MWSLPGTLSSVLAGVTSIGVMGWRLATPLAPLRVHVREIVPEAGTSQ
jgi:hypothetical protein